MHVFGMDFLFSLLFFTVLHYTSLCSTLMAVYKFAFLCISSGYAHYPYQSPDFIFSSFFFDLFSYSFILFFLHLSSLFIILIFHLIPILVSAVLGTVISIVVVAVVSYTTSLSSKSRLMLFNGAFLVVIIFGEGLYFGKKFLEIFSARRLGRAVHGGEHRSSSKNIERSFIEMVKGGNRGSYWSCREGDSCGESDTHLLHELVRLIGMLKKAHTPEAKLRLCNEQVTQWKSMLMLISDNLVSTGTISTSTATTSDDKEEEKRQP